MTHPFKRTFKRLAVNISDAREAIDERLRITAVQDAQWRKLHEIDERLRNLADDLLGVLAVGDIAAGKSQENIETLNKVVDDLADTTTLVGGAEVFMLDPKTIRQLMETTSEASGKVAGKLLTPEARARWLEWLRDGNN